MPAQTPQQAHELFVQYFNAGDVDAILSLYERDALLVTERQPVRGHTAIREAAQGWLSLKGHMDLTVDKMFQSDDIAILFSNWILTGTDPDGTPVRRSGQTADVVRRQADGSWLFVIDNPQGAAATRD
jgi:ketosteroid isomerase-like protein